MVLASSTGSMVTRSTSDRNGAGVKVVAVNAHSRSSSQAMKRSSTTERPLARVTVRVEPTPVAGTEVARHEWRPGNQRGQAS